MSSPLVFALAIVATAALATLSRAELNPNGSSNIFVYHAQASGRNVRLEQLCLHQGIDAVILGFVRDFTGANGYPTIDFGPWICPDKRPPDSAIAPGLATCPDLSQQVLKCQATGKKIFVSIGGATSNTSFVGEGGGKNAEEAARMLWQLFGDSSTAPELRPLGNVVVDGFDIDHEVGPPTNYDTFTKTLRSLTATASKPMWISAAPICSLTNRSIGAKTLALVDFIFVRFYNSKDCSIGGKGFAASLAKWYSTMPDPAATFPKFYLSGLSFENNNSGFVRPEDFANAIAMARKPDLQRFNENKFGGVTLWDGSRGLATMAGNGLDFFAYTKNVLENP